MKTFPLEGVPSRTRVASDGSIAVATVFVAGDSYAVDGFSTRTLLFDLRRHSSLGDLEDFQVERDGRSFKSIDFNFWGVTFSANPDRFYAVLASARRLYLVEGRVSARRLGVIREGNECPSLSPDGRRIAFKAREFQVAGSSGGCMSSASTQRLNRSSARPAVSTTRRSGLITITCSMPCRGILMATAAQMSGSR
jgi:WD40-like Beta Propeller Repeat